MLYIQINFGSLTDWIQVICAIVVMFCTVLMARYAKQALDSWKKQNDYEIFSLGRANLYNILDFLRKHIFTEIKYNEDEVVEFYNNLNVKYIDNPEYKLYHQLYLLVNVNNTEYNAVKDAIRKVAFAERSKNIKIFTLQKYYHVLFKLLESLEASLRSIDLEFKVISLGQKLQKNEHTKLKSPLKEMSKEFHYSVYLEIYSKGKELVEFSLLEEELIYNHK